MSIDPIAEEKSAIRRAAGARRDALPPAERAQAAETIAARPFPLPVAPGAIVSGFMPLKSETNPLPLMRKFSDAGARLALPAIDGRGKPLIMRAYAIGDALAAGQWGIREPLLAFDRNGNRIGYGAGYYDMTIAKFRAVKSVLAVGIAYAAQEIAAVPVTPRDARLDLVLTENETIDLRGA
jgi:5-formyltetrahydrofolate cyclo-ligase